MRSEARLRTFLVGYGVVAGASATVGLLLLFEGASSTELFRLIEVIAASGIAGGVGALAISRPLVRSLGDSAAVVGWTLVGVVAAHVAFGLWGLGSAWLEHPPRGTMILQNVLFVMVVWPLYSIWLTAPLAIAGGFLLRRFAASRA